MHEKSELESYGKEHVTFDCPWCGAISGIAPSHEGESFTCPECDESTKLTPENTRKGHLTEAPPDAPHHEEGGETNAKSRFSKDHPAHETSKWESYGKEHLTFDCPWCGAISGVDPTHLGQHFTCPECHKATKLTEGTTRKSEIAEAPPGAPHHEERSSKLPLVIGGVLLIVAAIVVAVIASGPGGDEEGQTRADRPDVPAPPLPGPSTVPPGGVPSDAPADAPPPGDAPPAAVPPDAVPSDVPPGQLPGQLPDEPPPAEPPSAVVEAEAELARATQALEAWKAANPEAARCLTLADACGEVTGEIQRLLADVKPAAATVAEARAYNDAVRSYIGDHPNRVRVATQLAQHLNVDRVRATAYDSWTNLNFFEPRVRETLTQLHDALCAIDASEYEVLLAAADQAAAALEAAKSEGAAPGNGAPDDPVPDDPVPDDPVPDDPVPDDPVPDATGD